MKDSFEENEHITFSELSLIESADIVLCVTIETAIKISNQHLADDANSGAEIFHLWVHKLLPAYNMTANSSLHTITKCLTSCSRNMLKAIPDANNPDWSTCITDFLELLKWMQTGKIHVLPLIEFVLDTIHILFDRNREFGGTTEADTFIQHPISLIGELLKIIDSHIVSVLNKSTFNSYTEVISKLCNLMEFDALNFKMACEAYKCIGKLTIGLANGKIFETESTKGWASQPFHLVLQKINDNMLSLYKKAKDHVGESYVEKCVRVINFYIKLLLKMSSSYKHDTFPVVPEFFKLFSFFKSIPIQLTGTKVADYVAKYLNKDMEEIFCMICKHPSLTDLLLNDGVDLSMIMEYLKAVVKSHDENYVKDKSDFMLNLFMNITKDSRIIHHPEYSTIIVLYASLIVLDKSGELKKDIILQVLRGDLHIALMSVDILLVVGNYCHKRNLTKIIDADTEYWRKCNSMFARFSDNRQQIFVKRLLRYFCKLKGTKNLEQDLDLHENFRYTYEVAPLLLTNDLRRTSFANDLINKLHSELEKMYINCTVADYYQLISTMKMLAKLKVNISLERQKKILELVRKVFARADSFQSFFRLTNACLELSLNFESNTIEMMINLLNEWLLHKSNLRTSPVEVLCLATYSKHSDSNVRKSAASLLKYLDGNAEGKVIRIILNQEPRNIDRSMYYSIPRPHLSNAVLSLDDVHTCDPIRTNTDCPANTAKRSCMDIGANDYLNVILEQLKLIKILSEQKILDINDSIHLKTILDCANKILEKHKK